VVNEKKNEEIERGISEDASMAQTIFKLLLLGSGDSGKSTMFKQTRTLWGPGFSDDDRAQYISVIFANILYCCKTLCEHVPKFGGLLTEGGKESAKVIGEIKGGSDLHGDAEDVFVLPPELVPHIKTLWADPGIKKTFDNRNEFQLPDSCSYFFARLDAIAAPNYLPTYQDILSVRIRTTGITTSEFTMSDVRFQLFDVGGQRNERKKWIHCFESVTAVLFVAAINEYDQVLFEDMTVNRMNESLNLFDQIVNSQWFTRATIVLFLNKSDLFKEKIQRKPLSCAFPMYNSGASFEDQSNYIKSLYLSKNKTSGKKINVHITCALDQDNIKKSLFCCL